MALIVDASVAVGWCAPSQRTDMSRTALVHISREGGLVPHHFPLELLHALRRLERRVLLEPAQIDAFIENLSGLPLTIMDIGGFSASAKLLALSREFAISIYDAAYLELAQQHNGQLATRDEALREAAIKAGVAVFEN